MNTPKDKQKKVELNTIIEGDCLEIMPSIPDKSIDMILADLPYGTTACKWDTIIPFEPLWKQYKRIIKDNGAIVLTASQPFTSVLMMSNINMFKYEWVWKKNKPSNIFQAKNAPLKYHENILIFSSATICPTSNNKMKYYPQGIKATNKQTKSIMKSNGIHGNRKTKKYTITQTNYPKSIIQISVEQSKHPTQKPVALFEYLIKTYTNEGDTVLDNVIGSGTTAVACINLERNFIGIEKEPKYVEIARNRINSLQPKLV